MNALILSGCNTMFLGSYGEQNQSLKEFAESVFVFQNRMTNIVMLKETEPSTAILNAEKNMHIACESLNKAGNLYVEGLSVDFELAQRIQQTAENCQNAAKQLEILLISP